MQDILTETKDPVKLIQQPQTQSQQIIIAPDAPW